LSALPNSGKALDAANGALYSRFPEIWRCLNNLRPQKLRREI
jgi:hypothetical protein